jgi:hypothetical protein
VGVQNSRLYEGASRLLDTSPRVQFGMGGGHQELSRARYSVCKRSSRLMSSKREGIVHPIVSKSAITLHLGFPIHEVHCFSLKLVNKVLYGQKHCLLLIKNSQNQPQQAKAQTAQTSSNLAGKCRRKAGYFRVKAGRVQPLQIPASH